LTVGDAACDHCGAGAATSTTMTASSYNLHGTQILALSPDGKKVRTDRDAVELIGEAYEHAARLIVIPVERFEDAFFELRTRVAGEILGKFATYRMRVAIVGDISRHVEESSALRAFVIECNRGSQIWFLANADELAVRLEQESKWLQSS
jgi:Domain of unknown function (DUF4180)